MPVTGRIKGGIIRRVSERSASAFSRRVSYYH